MIEIGPWFLAYSKLGNTLFYASWMQQKCTYYYERHDTYNSDLDYRTAELASDHVKYGL